MTTCIIFGGAGFIGAHLARRLLATGRFDHIHLADLRPSPLPTGPALSASVPGLTAGPVPLATEPAPFFIPETEALFRERLHSLSSHAQVLVVLWPDRPTTQGLVTERAAYQEFARHVQEQVSRSAGQQVRVLNVLEAPGLSQDLYRDGIHPSPNGNTYLAGLIAAAIRTNEP